MNFQLNTMQSLTQKMTMEQLQHLSILQLSATELESYISEKAKENPLLTVVEPKIDHLNHLVDLSSIHTDFKSNTLSQQDHNYMQTVFIQRESNTNLLIEQIPLGQNLSHTDIKILKYLIRHLDDNYFLDIELGDVSNEFNVDVVHTEKILNLLQTFEPIGVGARNIKEFLLIQINNDFEAPSFAKEFVTNYLEKVASLSVKFLSNQYKISVKETQKTIQYIKNLKPIPSVPGSSNFEEYIIPEMSVEKVNNEWIIKTNSQLKSTLTVNEEYVALLKNCSENGEYYETCLKDVMLLMYGIEQRDRTLYKLTRLLLDLQTDFFEKGIDAVQPIQLKDVANLLDLHESTISRAIKNKYIKTPNGIFAYKSLFPKGISNASGKKDAVSHIKQKISSLIENEIKDSPYTDQQLTEKLTNEGFQISRRTVAKYRESLNILNSDKRVYLYQQ